MVEALATVILLGLMFIPVLNLLVGVVAGAVLGGPVGAVVGFITGWIISIYVVDPINKMAKPDRRSLSSFLEVLLEEHV
jgi:hypothetical protein